MNEPFCHVNVEAGCSLVAVNTTRDAMNAKKLPVLRYCSSYETSYGFLLLY